MRRLLVLVGLAAALLLATPARAAEIAVQSWNTPWDPGAENCAAHPHPPLEVHRFDSKTFVLRENLCATWEAPFMYLLIGNARALLIDTGDVADARMPLAATVYDLLGAQHALSLIVAHTHRHLDHRAGDSQFKGAGHGAPTIVGYDIDSVKRYYGFKDWPNGIAHVDLGGRVVDVIPAPGHNETQIVFYDRNTGLLFSGDFLMPARLLVDDPAAYVASAQRVADFVRDKKVAGVLGGHVEMNRAGEVYDWESTYHPDEHALALGKADVLALPATLTKFNGFYAQSGHVIMIDPTRNLLAVVIAASAVFVAAIAAVILGFRRWQRSHAGARIAA